jgi:putative membrane protein
VATEPVRYSPLVHLRSLGSQFIRGCAMGAADIVPGISGGTVALVTGIYERLIANIGGGAQFLKALITGRLGLAGQWARKIEWAWLISLLAGVLITIALLSSVLTNLLESQPVRTAAVFFGLVAGATWITGSRMRAWGMSHLGIVVAAAVGLFFVLGLRSETEATKDSLVTQPLWVFFAAGAVAICAMILPGISGSLILVMLGMYSEVLAAISERNLGALAATALGCVLGLALFSTLLNWMLFHHHDRVIAAMIGLMIGSLRVLWPWPGGTATTSLGAPSGDLWVPMLLGAVAIFSVIVVERVAQGVTSAANREMPSTKSSSPSANENLA